MMIRRGFVASIFIGVLLAVAQATVAVGVEVALPAQNHQGTKEHNGEVIKPGEVIALDRCIEIALKRHPNIVAAGSTVAINKSRVGQAEANYYPHIDLSGGYSRIYSASDLSRSAGSNNPYDQYNTGINLKQNIYDFGKTSAQRTIQRFNVEGSRSDLENTVTRIVFVVRQAYYTLLQTMRSRTVAEETVKQFQRHLEQAKGFFEVGTKPRFDVTRAEVDLSTAGLNLIKAENAVRLAMVNLNNAMGVRDAPAYSIEDTLSFQRYPVTIGDAVSKAFENRPDIKASVARRKAAEENITLALKGYYPALTGNAGYSWSGEKFPLNDGWNVGAVFTFPLFSGNLTKYQVEEARANLSVVTANEEFLKQNVVLEVQQAYLNLKEAEERIPAAELTVKQAEENLDIANGRYAAGVGNPIEVTDAQVAYVNAKTAYITALSDYKIAQAAIEKAMGGR